MNKNNFSTLIIIVCLFVLTFFPPSSHSEPLEKIIQGLQTYLNNSNNFAATFVQESELKSFNERQIAEGKVYFMKPGKMKWEYEKPEIQTIVVNNKKVWLYSPEENQVIETKIDALGAVAIYDLFLSDNIILMNLFRASLIEQKVKTKNEELLLELFPKNDEVNINKIILKLIKTDYRIKSFIIHDKMENITTITFSDIKINKGLKPSIFDFKIPEGVELITP
jgi:outer membrane lipoprotein carrier protein